MPRTVKIATANITGYGGVSPDPRDQVIETGSAADQAKYIPSLYEGETTSIDVIFTVEYTDEAGTVLGTSNASNVSTTFNFTQYGMTATKVNNYTLRIAGTYSNAFSDQYYRFVLDDMSLVLLPPTTTVKFKALVEYNKPNIVQIENNYETTVRAPDDFGGVVESNISYTFKQWIVWRYQSAIAAITSLVAQGKV